MNLSKTLKHMGPGLLYAAAAVGVSHVVQSTRAGAEFGYELIWAIIAAHVIKYPFFKAGPLYSSITGKTLLHGYKQVGKWAIAMFFVLTLATMFVVQAAVTMVTAGLAQNILGPEIFGVNLDVATYALIMLGISAAILGIGKFSLLDNFIKGIVIILTLTTLAAVVICAFADLPKHAPALDFDFSSKAHIFFLVALVGWMPAPMDIPVWHSVWTVAKQNSEEDQISVKESVRDFNFGFFGTALLAIFFLSLGSMIMYQTPEKFASGAGAFAAQFIKLYTQALGPWSWPIIAIAAFSTMFSTTLACLDAFARITQESCYQWSENENFQKRSWYFFWLQITGFGALSIIFFSMQNMKALVDFATTLSFVIAPVLALLNYMVMRTEIVPAQYRYKGKEAAYCVVGIVLFSLFTFYYLQIRFF